MAASNVTPRSVELDEHASTLASEIGQIAVSIYQLASASTADPSSAAWNLVAIENLAKVISRKADVLDATLGGMTNGNFQDEFDAESVLARRRASA